MPEDAPQAAQAALENTAPGNDTIAAEVVGDKPTAPASGRRPSFRDIRRQLTEEELKQTGVQKLLIEDFERAEVECEALRTFIERYHDKDKEVARLTEKLKTNLVVEITTSVGLAGGGAIVSLATLFWEPGDHTKGIATLGVGFFFLIGAAVAKGLQVRK
jgi:hypothetical protein